MDELSQQVPTFACETAIPSIKLEIGETAIPLLIRVISATSSLLYRILDARSARCARSGQGVKQATLTNWQDEVIKNLRMTDSKFLSKLQ